VSNKILRSFILQKKLNNCNYLFEIFDESFQNTFQFSMITFISKNDDVVKWQHLINKTFDDTCFSATHQFFFQIIHDRSMIFSIVFKFQNSSVFFEFHLDWNIHDFMSLIKESFSWLIVIEKSFAVFENIFINMSKTKCMLNDKKNRRNCVYQTYLTIRDYEYKIRNIKFLIQFKNLLQNSLETWDNLRQKKCKSYVKNDV
jgi:hypothetical protein